MPAKFNNAEWKCVRKIMTRKMVAIETERWGDQNVLWQMIFVLFSWENALDYFARLRNHIQEDKLFLIFGNCRENITGNDKNISSVEFCPLVLHQNLREIYI